MRDGPLNIFPHRFVAVWGYIMASRFLNGIIIIYYFFYNVCLSFAIIEIRISRILHFNICTLNSLKIAN